MKPQDIQVLREIANFEQTTPETEYPLGWSWRQVKIWPSTLNRLVIEDLIRVTFSSNSYTGYRLTEKGKLTASEAEPMNPITKPRTLEIPNDLFSPIEGYEEIKELVRRVLRSEKPVHILFTGVPSSAKTMFLIELSKIGAVYILGSQATKAGIADTLFDLEPKLLLVDEIDRIGAKDIAILLSLAETGILSQTKHGKRREANLQTKIFAASNSINMPPELISRFLVLRFAAYEQAEFAKVTTSILVKREGVESNLAEYIAGKVLQTQSSFPDPRQAVRIARLATTREEVDKLIEVLNRFGEGWS